MTTGVKFLINGIIISLFILSSCTFSSKDDSSSPIAEPLFRPGGGSSGMVQVNDSQYLVVYDLKRFEEGPRMGMITVSTTNLAVKPLKVTGWDATGISSDLESVCAIPGKNDEYLMAESGAWQDNTGRIFHVLLDTAHASVTVLGHFKIPMMHPNDIGVVGDQYEAIHCVPYKGDMVMVILGERGGSEVNPDGIIRWGIADLESHVFTMEGEGLKGIPVTAPGEWTQQTHRHITDFYLDDNGFLWTAGCEDVGDSGPFYSVIYKIGILNKEITGQPVSTAVDNLTYKVIDGFKIESLSGPAAGIQATHSFGTEDEIFGGVWRPINIKN